MYITRTYIINVINKVTSDVLGKGRICFARVIGRASLYLSPGLPCESSPHSSKGTVDSTTTLCGFWSSINQSKQSFTKSLTLKADWTGKHSEKLFFRLEQPIWHRLRDS